MHEYSIMAEIVKAALASLKNYDVENVETVFLEVGELTFLNPEQLKFCYNVLTENNILADSSLEIMQKNAEIECTSCGFKGTLKERPQEDHFRIPIISCPKCEGEIKLLSGRECIIKSIKMNIKSEENNKGEDRAINTS
jgi:hydrogenase nickel incorporation protein HypA/HybF